MRYSELRASNEDRERVVGFLREHALLGRLNDEELEERIGLAYAAVTVGDLERLISDLPRGRRGPRPVASAAAELPRRRRCNAPPLLVGLGIGAFLLTGIPFAIVGVMIALAAGLLALVFALSIVFGPVLLVVLLIMAASRRRRSRPPMPQY
jgi:hypothetical protein